MKRHQTKLRCPLCDGVARITTEWGWVDDDTCTATLCCPDCRTVSGVGDEAVEVSHGATEREAIDGIDYAAWIGRLCDHAEIVS